MVGSLVFTGEYALIKWLTYKNNIHHFCSESSVKLYG